jgi:hypothetical protein
MIRREDEFEDDEFEDDEAAPITWHPQVRIYHGDTSALVDKQMAPLILALWRNGIATQASCQGDEQRMASISFCSGVDADRFVALVHPWRLLCDLYPDSHPQSASWKWDATLGGDDGVIFVHIHFPPSDLPAILAAAQHPDTRSFGEWLDARQALRNAAAELHDP